MIGKQSLLSVILGAMLLLPLGGCIFTRSASKPLLTGATADFPFRSMVLAGSDGQLPVVRQGDTYVIDDPTEGRVTLLLKKAGDNIYVYQATMGKRKSSRRRVPEIAYSIVKFGESDLDHLWCGSWSAATLKGLGIAVIADPLGLFPPECDFTRLDQLVNLSAKQPDGKWPAVKLKIVSIEK